jgi:hypothetical protein
MDEEWPRVGSDVVLSDVRKYPQGWRAHHARFCGQSDESRNNPATVAITATANRGREAETMSDQPVDSIAVLGEETVVRLQNWAKRWKWLLWALVPIAVAPLTAIILWGILGILSLIVAGAISISAIIYAPVYVEKLKNRRTKALMNEARKHPIETHTNIYLARKRRIAEADQRIVNFETAVGVYTSKRIAYERKHPTDTQTIDLWRKEENRLTTGLANKKARQAAARRALAALKEKMDVAKDRMEVAVSLVGARSMAENAEMEAWEEIKLDIGFDEVDRKLNQAIAELNHEMEVDSDFVSQLPPPIRAELPAMPTADVIDISVGNPSQKAKVLR